MSEKETAPGEALHDFFYDLFALQAALSDKMDGVHEAAGWHTPQVRVAEMLHRRDTATVPDIAAQLRLSRQGVQTVCNELAAMGAVAYIDNPRHKRSKLMHLTAMGQDKLAQFRKREGAIIESLLPTLHKEQLAVAHDVICRILHGIR